MIGNVFTSIDFPGASNSRVQGIDDEGIMNESAQLNVSGNPASQNRRPPFSEHPNAGRRFPFR